MVARVRDEDLVLGVGGHVPRVVELPGPVALLPEGHEELPVDGEDLDPVVVLVGHDGPVHPVAAHAGRAVKLPVQLAGGAELVVEATGLVVNLI